MAKNDQKSSFFILSTSYCGLFLKVINTHVDFLNGISTQLFQSQIISLNMIGLYTSPLFYSILPERIGYIIQQRRKLLGLTQQQLAGKTHIFKHMISKIERG